MIIKRFTPSINVKTVTYSGNQWLSYNRSGISQGATFTYNAVDVSAGTSLLDDGTFSDTVIASLDEDYYLTDENGNTYFKVTNYSIDNGTTTPTIV
ncbi:MAG: hypothetical protein [Bacteriophage sp.]|nr:MAG: hypothetical protein [Bacteriophage sp.]